MPNTPLVPLRIEVRTRQYELTPTEQRNVDATLSPIRRLTERFPVSDLHIDVNHHPSTGDLHIKASLRLPRRTLFTGERGDHLLPTLDRCVQQLVKKVSAYKEKLRGHSAIRKLHQHAGGS